MTLVERVERAGRWMMRYGWYRRVTAHLGGYSPTEHRWLTGLVALLGFTIGLALVAWLMVAR